MVLTKASGAKTVRVWFDAATNWMGKNAYIMSGFEVLFALVISNAALFIAMFVYLLMASDDSSNLAGVAVSTLRGSIKTTEVVVYILGFLAPALWIIVSNARAWRHMYFLIVLLIIQGLVIVSTSLIYALSIAKVLNNQALASSWAWCSLAAALIVWYITLVYQKKVLLNLEHRIERPVVGRESGSAVMAGLGDD